MGAGTHAAGSADAASAVAVDVVGVVWVSLDPRSGGLGCYPAAAAARVEAAHRSGVRVVPLAGLGLPGPLESAWVDLGDDDQRPQQRTTTGGRRDVRRFEIQAGITEISVSVVQQRGWRIADFSVEGVTEEQHVPISLANVVPIGGGDALLLAAGGFSSASASGFPPASASSAGPGGGPSPCCFGASSASGEEARAARVAAASESDERGLVALWEWCRLAEPADLEALPREEWGVYNEEQNTEIEAAFRAGLPAVDLVVGIRSYKVVFEGPVYSRQEDRGLKKRRFVRRRVVDAVERDMALSAVAAAGNNLAAVATTSGECAICCTAFSETLAMPVLKLPACGHLFHGACVQQLADSRGDCPLCRSSVDWKMARLVA